VTSPNAPFSESGLPAHDPTVLTAADVPQPFASMGLRVVAAYLEAYNSAPTATPKGVATRRSCADLLPGHRHCLHGHTEDCPDPSECDLLPVVGFGHRTESC